MYDTDSRLVGIAAVSRGSPGVAYTYDWSNRLMAKRVGKETTRYVYDGWAVIGETKGNSTLQTRYVVGPRIDEVLSQSQKNGKHALYLSRDGLGSTTEVTQPNGNVVQRYEYDPFGAVKVLGASGAPVPDAPKTNYLFTGREYQPESGLYNYRNRFYHPGIGRFLQPDPVGFLGGDSNLYAYVWNNPTNWVDPSGQYAVAVQVTFLLGIVLAYTVWNAFQWTKKYPIQLPRIFRAEKSKERNPCPVKPPEDPSQPPGPDWVWRGKGTPGSEEGGWFNPKTGETLHPDLNHPLPEGPHWDYRVRGQPGKIRIRPDGTIIE